jgi:hypothetical protein
MRSKRKNTRGGELPPRPRIYTFIRAAASCRMARNLPLHDIWRQHIAEQKDGRDASL